MTEVLIALLALTLMEIVLGIDNIVFIAILSGKLKPEEQAKARNIGLAAAMITRILLLFCLTWVLSLKEPLFHLSQFGLFTEHLLHHEHRDAISVRDLILLAGGLFLMGKSVSEIHEKVEGGQHSHEAPKHPSFASVIIQIAILDIVFSLDSVITAVGMAKDIWVMVAAVVIAVGVMLVFSGKISRFVERHPTIKILALSFLVLIGVMLVAEAFEAGMDKGYIYFAMAFALLVEMLNLRLRVKQTKTAH